MSKPYVLIVNCEDPEIMKKVCNAILALLCKRMPTRKVSCEEVTLHSSQIEVYFKELFHCKVPELKKLALGAVRNAKVQRSQLSPSLEILIDGETLDLPKEYISSDHGSSSEDQAGEQPIRELGCFVKGPAEKNAGRLYFSKSKGFFAIIGISLCIMLLTSIYEQVFNVVKYTDRAIVDKGEDSAALAEIFLSFRDQLKVSTELDKISDHEKQHIRGALLELIKVFET